MILTENYKNLCPFFDIGLIQSKDNAASEVIVYNESAHTTIKRIVSNGIILNPVGSNLTNTLSNSVLNIGASGLSGSGAFGFCPFEQNPNILVNGRSYAIIFDITGTTTNSADLIGFADTLNNLVVNGVYPQNAIYKNINSNLSNLNCYYIFTCDDTLISSKQNFMVGWSDLSDKTINLKLTTLQLYDITEYASDGISNFELWMLQLLKTYSYLETNQNKYNNNGIIEIPSNFVES